VNADDARHGTRHGYRDDKCKCDACKKAIALEHNVYKLRRAANGGQPLTVPKVGAVRRIQALMANGWPRRELARQAGYQGDAFALILNGRRAALTLASDRRIRDLFDRLADTPGPSSSSALRAQAKGWPLPGSWLDIDDPAETPDPGWQPRRYRSPELAAEWDHLRAAGVSIHTAAGQLGVTVGAIEKAIERVARGSAA
jgi:hypothetical protein